jgi:uncharacterized protein (DUF2336 family)
LTAQFNTRDLVALAQSRDGADRERLLLAVADLCASSPPEARKPGVQDLLDDVFMALVVEAERDIRRVLAEKLAGAEWAPSALVNVLALDDIEIARPIILNSPLLQEKDLIRLLIEATVEHQIEVARRPHLTAKVADAIAEAGEPAVMTALAGNETADIGPDAMTRLVASARRVASLRSPLSRHPKLSRMLAEQLYGVVGQALRTALIGRFRIDPDALEEALGDSVVTARGGRAPAPSNPERDNEREEMERLLIAKLESAGQLRPGYLIRALKERKLGLFESAMATLGGFAVADVRRAVRGHDPEPIALACCAVGIDRVVFPSLLLMVRELNGGLPGGGPEAGKRAVAALSRQPENAAAAFRALMTGV